ncbi:hypothetical protein PLICRDRAFT_179934 [Plicaturopsis crispa FD-325 SS-3]|uniref:Uncharacterized protein n=1 Tax=Plicaturopsis crispa FD-325 SS-3 TaxID=944288 RepID=A0A0C9SKK6_PLICR|nr:hypothetical protein PLICRDRAFT_179934 [Plicaturopsis crispa FD-325 SS-3]
MDGPRTGLRTQNLDGCVTVNWSTDSDATDVSVVALAPADHTLPAQQVAVRCSSARVHGPDKLRLRGYATDASNSSYAVPPATIAHQCCLHESGPKSLFARSPMLAETLPPAGARKRTSKHELGLHSQIRQPAHKGSHHAPRAVKRTAPRAPATIVGIHSRSAPYPDLKPMRIGRGLRESAYCPSRELASIFFWVGKRTFTRLATAAWRDVRTYSVSAGFQCVRAIQRPVQEDGEQVRLRTEQINELKQPFPVHPARSRKAVSSGSLALVQGLVRLEVQSPSSLYTSPSTITHQRARAVLAHTRMPPLPHTGNSLLARAYAFSNARQSRFQASADWLWAANGLTSPAPLSAAHINTSHGLQIQATPYNRGRARPYERSGGGG